MRKILIAILLITFTVNPSPQRKSSTNSTLRIEKKLDAFNEELNSLVHELENRENL